jgi:hypothetical protein
MMKEEAEFMKWRAIATLMVDRVKGAEAFDEYAKSAFPYLEKERSKEKNDLIEALRREVANGPISIRKVGKPKAKSRLRASYDRNAIRSDKVLSKIGPVIPTSVPNVSTGSGKA